jgi:hypothetical protein
VLVHFHALVHDGTRLRIDLVVILVGCGKERIYQTLLEWIIDGTLAPGEKTQRFGNFQIF